MGIICDTCGRDIDALGQDNMGVDAPLCEDCWGEQQSHTVAVPRREARNLRFENARLREKLDAGTEETAVQNLRKESGLEISDRIAVTWQAEGALAAAFSEHADLIADETLAVRFEAGTPQGAAHEFEVEGDQAAITLERVAE